MNYDQLLVIFGGATFAVSVLLIVIPYLLGRRDLITPSTFYLSGTALFIGVSAIGSGTQPHFVEYPAEVYQMLLLGFAVFYAVLFLTYLYWKLPRRLAGRVMLRLPKVSTTSMLALSVLSVLLIPLVYFPPPIPGAQSFLLRTLIHLGPFAVIFALTAVHHDRSNPVCWMNLLLITAAALILSMSFGGGRRSAVGVVMAFPIFAYWAWLRYKPGWISLTMLMVLMFSGYAFLDGYDKVRRRETDEASAGIARAVQSARLSAENAGSVLDSSLIRTAQPSVECALLAIHTFAGPYRSREVEPFGVLYYIAVNPIPRAFWPEKPVSLAARLPQLGKEIYGFVGYGNVVWSMNPVAQGYHDGGLLPIAVYAVLFGFFLRFVDELLIRQPTNPFILGFLSTNAGNLAGFARGSVDVMSWGLIGSTVSFLFLYMIARLLFGTGTVFSRTDHVLTYPNLRSIQRSLQP
jgi:hypothetical protein